ncbi:AIPR family protein [Micromonospora purpureochromogenes]|uniref:AIPR family protein n=1 Tax=Micromonospora purpureochromogenes TaxID=47872 RepID=UPI0033F98D3D
MASSSPDRIVVNSHFKEYCETEYPGEKPDDVFERYAVTLVTKPRELAPEELADGIVDGGHDGGIDSFFVFLNGTLLSPDDARLNPGSAALRQLTNNPQLEVFLVQAKNVERWEEAAWEHLLASLPKLLDVEADEADLEKLYRADVVERTGILRKAILSLGSKFPKVTFRAVYVTRAPESNLTPSIQARADQVGELIRSQLISDANVTTEHVGIKGLYVLAAKDYGKPLELKFRNLLRESNSYIGVAAIQDYLSFIRDEEGLLREELFESNVRDYEGGNYVNEAIGETLKHSDELEFWWLNNGVTVLGDEVYSPQQTMNIKRPLIVNGLQTSHVLHRAVQEGALAPERLGNGIVVRVIQSTDEDTRDRIIAGTNRQTQVPGPALYATQQLQRDIERFLYANGWYYERRKNRYKNQGKPAKRRITMNFLAQAMITVMLGRPDSARARPSTLISSKEGYERVFPASLDPHAYLVAVEILKGTDEFLATEAAKDILDEFSNVRFYVLAGYVILELKLRDTSKFWFEKNLQRLSRPLNSASLIKALSVLKDTAAAYQAAHPKVSRDTVFKSSDFRDQYFAELAANQ